MAPLIYCNHITHLLRLRCVEYADSSQFGSHMSYPVIFLTTLFIATQLLAGCWPTFTTFTATASLGNINSIKITIRDNYYGDIDANLTAPPTWVVPSGADIVAAVINEGDLTHNWAIVKKSVSIPVPFDEGQSSDLIEYGAGMVYGKNRTTLTFTAPKEIGEYVVICTVPGHYPSMQGRLVVE